MFRGTLDWPVLTPKLTPLIVVPGALKTGVLVKLKASARNWSLNLSVRLKFLNKREVKVSWPCQRERLYTCVKDFPK